MTTQKCTRPLIYVISTVTTTITTATAIAAAVTKLHAMETNVVCLNSLFVVETLHLELFWFFFIEFVAKTREKEKEKETKNGNCLIGNVFMAVEKRLVLCNLNQHPNNVAMPHRELFMNNQSQ